MVAAYLFRKWVVYRRGSSSNLIKTFKTAAEQRVNSHQPCHRSKLRVAIVKHEARVAAVAALCLVKVFLLEIQETVKYKKVARRQSPGIPSSSQTCMGALCGCSGINGPIMVFPVSMVCRITPSPPPGICWETSKPWPISGLSKIFSNEKVHTLMR